MSSTTYSRLDLLIEHDGRVVHPREEVRTVLAVADGDMLPGSVVSALESGERLVRVSSVHGDISFVAYELPRNRGWLLTSHAGREDPPPPPGLPDAGEIAYRAFFEQAPVGIVHLDAGGRITFENHALRQIVGEDVEDSWLGRHVSAIPLLRAFLLPVIDAMLARGTPFDGAETVLSRADGTERRLHIVGSPIRDYDGVLVGGVLTIQDVTDARLAEELLRRARLEAESASRMKTALIATISHELRTPAGTIHGYASMLEQELRALGESAIGSPVPIEFAEAVRVRAEDLVRLVGDLTLLAQIEAGTVTLQPEAVEMDSLLRDVVAKVPVQSNGPDIEVSGCRDVAVWADGIRLRIIVERVVGNALKFTPEGSVRVRCGQDGSAVNVEVTDTGVGIDPDALEHVFDPFTQEDDPLNRRFEGAGLGLAVVSRLVELMDGTVDIDSSKGVGTTVRIHLPAAGQGEPRFER